MAGKRVLIIDDEEDLCFFVKQNLASTGLYTVEYVTDPDEGIKLAQRNRPDLILLDITMPKKDGFAVLRVLKQQSRTMNIPVIMLTAVQTDEAKLKASESYCEDYLNKPVSRDTLLSAVAEVLQRHQRA